MPSPGFRVLSRAWRWPRIAGGLALAIVVAVGVTVGVIFIPTRHNSAQAASSHPTVPAGAATVQRRDLVETDTESGTLSYNNPQTVYNSLSGTITWLPSVGQVIKLGHALFKVDDQPVLLMNGNTPAYRDLDGSDTPGSDIKQLNEDLRKLGFNRAAIVPDDEWQYATTVGVEELQVAHGMTETGDLTLGQVVFLPGAQLINAQDVTIGSGSSGSGSSSSSSSSGSSSSGSPSSSGSATAIMQTSSTELVATVDLDASKQSEAKVGEKVTVQMPNGNFVDGVISQVSPVAQSSSSGSGSGSGASAGGSSGSGASGSDSSSSSGSSSSSSSSSGSSSTIPVTIRLKGHHSGSGLDQAAVSVNFAEQRAKHVLSVPVTALVATSGTTYAVQEATAPHKLIPVTVGLFAAGYVQISGSGIHPGLAVTDSQG